MLQSTGAPKTTIANARRTKLNPVDGTLVAVLIMLLLAGLLILFSATYYTAQDSGDPLGEVKKQLAGIALGAAAMAVTSRIPYRFWRDTWVVVGALALSAVLLVLVIIPGVAMYRTTASFASSEG